VVGNEIGVLAHEIAGVLDLNDDSVMERSSSAVATTG
jgi:hypothetical protein